MVNNYEAPGIEVLGQLHELTLAVPPYSGTKNFAPNSDGFYKQVKKQPVPIHS